MQQKTCMVVVSSQSEWNGEVRVIRCAKANPCLKHRSSNCTSCGHEKSDPHAVWCPTLMKESA